MKEKQESVRKISVEEDVKINQNKKRIRRVIFSLITIMITAGIAVGVSFAIGIVNKQKEKTGELKNNSSFGYSKIVKTKDIYK
ncbi:hypothetical protein [Mycoplasma todarodis]|uniref:Uncharacterized protein n=1 Tax=Mycoplasma todarodis TaxID=1937191 RepID=A0A4R0XS52_9MOLU|nr:hypothetical protein [Mycoplasma todarodis]TCG10517.1 hypothetical protein C4B25_03905 [Mycoplasma todarodis]